MKIAVCVSGILNAPNDISELTRYNRRLIEKFPNADFYYGTWESQRELFSSVFPKYKCHYFEDIKMHYHPYLGIKEGHYIMPQFPKLVQFIKKKKWQIEWSLHHTKQIIIHGLLSDSIPKKYDIVVRTRYDAFIHRDADFSNYIADSHKNSRAIGFATTQREKFNQLYPSDYKKDDGLMKKWMLDQLIIHPASMMNAKYAIKLHALCRLHPAEVGWYQVLSKPFGGNHLNYHGWVNHAKNIADEFLREQK